MGATLDVFFTLSPCMQSHPTKHNITMPKRIVATTFFKLPQFLLCMPYVNRAALWGCAWGLVCSLQHALKGVVVPTPVMFKSLSSRLVLNQTLFLTFTSNVARLWMSPLRSRTAFWEQCMFYMWRKRVGFERCIWQQQFKHGKACMYVKESWVGKARLSARLKSIK